MRIVVIIMLFLLINDKVVAQHLLWSKEMPEATIAGIDKQGNAYVIQQDMLYLFDVQGNIRYTYSNYSYGGFLHVNVSNPFKIYVLHAAGSVVVVLNNTLSVMSMLFIRGIMTEIEPLVISPSRTDGFWIYDRLSGQVLMFSNSIRTMYRSIDMRRLFPSGFEPDGMDWAGNHLVLYNRDGRIVMCDQFGQVIRHTVLPGKIYSVSERGIIFLSDDGIFIYDLLRLTEETLPINPTAIRAVYVQGTYLLLQRGQNIEMYQF